MKDTQAVSTSVLCWPKRLLSADDLRRHLTSQRELLLLPRTVITPLAADELRSRGIAIHWQVSGAEEARSPDKGTWCYVQEKPDAIVASAVQALTRDGIKLAVLCIAGAPVPWARVAAEAILRAEHAGGILFCGDAAVAACIANKMSGLRAAAVGSVAQAARVKKNLGANVFAIEVPGPTFFELRQILKTIATGAPGCPPKIADILKELDGHAPR